eukprot:11457483-Ditylum_brightwellii.AAC.1
MGGCCTFESASVCGCCLPANPYYKQCDGSGDGENVIIALGTLVWIGRLMPPVALSATEGLGWKDHGR